MTTVAPAPHRSYPLHVDARLDAPLSRWLWLVKWLLSIPHWIVLGFLWVAFVVLSVVAFFAILFTGRYPRAIFDFNVGVLRWSWRVAYYSYGALGTDRYPPFSLADVPDYPATLSVDYPEHLSRGLVLVKWWLLAIPHYLVVGIFVGGGGYWAWEADSWVWHSGSTGLIAILVCISAVVLLFTGRYPRTLYDFILGMNRWALRVAAYAGLMTDAYPPFRLDMGGTEDGGTMTMPPQPGAPGGDSRHLGPMYGAPSEGPSSPGAEPPPTYGAQPPAPPAYGAQPPAPPAYGAPPAYAAPAPPSKWTTGRIIAVVMGAFSLLIGAGLLIGGGAVLWVDRTQRDAGGYLVTSTDHLSTTTYALASGSTELRSDGPRWGVASSVLGTIKVNVTGPANKEVFVGIGRTVDVETYLRDVGHAQVRGLDNKPKYDVTPGGAPKALPENGTAWVAKSVGTGQQTLTWKPSSGSWTAVVMNADGTAPVAADVSIGAKLPILAGIVAGLLIAGVVFVIAGAIALFAGVRGAAR